MIPVVLFVKLHNLSTSCTLWVGILKTQALSWLSKLRMNFAQMLKIVSVTNSLIILYHFVPLVLFVQSMNFHPFCSNLNIKHYLIILFVLFVSDFLKTLNFHVEDSCTNIQKYLLISLQHARRHPNPINSSAVS